jgi:hypothetical protein
MRELNWKRKLENSNGIPKTPIVYSILRNLFKQINSSVISQKKGCYSQREGKPFGINEMEFF